jgi:hypothetical protein
VPITNSSSNEHEYSFLNRNADSWADSPASRALKRMQANPRVKYIVLIVPDNACPVCQNLTGTYPKEEVPPLPVEECSNPFGCRAFYLPYLDEIYP